MGLTKKQIQTVDQGPPRRAQTLFRLWSEDRRKLLKKMIDDKINLQSLMECLCLAYLHNEPHIREYVLEKLSNKPRHKARKYYGLDQDETLAILQQLERMSPLQDKEIVYNK